MMTQRKLNKIRRTFTAQKEIIYVYHSIKLDQSNLDILDTPVVLKPGSSSFLF